MNRSDEEETRARSLFREAIPKVAVAQICQSVGFTGSQHSALEALSDIATRYLEALAKSASSNANSYGRTECNLFDVIHAIEDMNSVQGFHGASDINKSLLDSAIIKDVMSFVYWVDEIPFAKPIPRSSMGKRSRISRESYDQNREFSHIPPWLPPLPEPSTYKDGEVRVGREEVRDGNEEENDRETNRVVDVEECGCEKGKGKKKSFLPAERPKVRFKMQLGLRSGVCRGGIEVKGCHGNGMARESKIGNRNRRA